MRELTRKQQRFIDEYVVDCNGTQAAIRAGYAKKTAAQMANEYLMKPHIKSEVDRRLKLASEEAQVSAEWVLTRLKKLAERCMQEVEPKIRANGLFKLDKATGKICFDFDSAGASKALELLGKTKGMFVDKHDVTVGGKMIIVRPKR